MAKNLSELCSQPRVLQKVEPGSYEMACLAEGISKQSIEGTAWILLTACDRMWDERNDLKMEFLIKREAGLEDSACVVKK